MSSIVHYFFPEKDGDAPLPYPYSEDREPNADS